MSPKRGPAMDRSMRSFRADRHALAEIVGTLMLVVIVVAAATAFSFFVAAYQKQLQAQETMNHDRNLESIKIIDVSESTCGSVGCENVSAPLDSFASISFLIASLDINTIWLTSLFLNDRGVVNFNATYSNGTTIHPCFNASAFISGYPLSGLVACGPTPLPAYATLNLTLDLDEKSAWAPAFGGAYAGVLPTSDLSFQILTQLTNLFTDAFAPPDAIASIFYVSNGSSSLAVLDGLDSYQPASANNASILDYTWTISNGRGTPVSLSGAEVEWPGLPAGTYNITLTVVNTDGLLGSVTLTYTQV